MEHKNRDIAVTLLFAVLFLGSVFIVFPSQYDLSETYRKYFTLIFGLIFVVVYAVLPDCKKNINGIFKTICLTGMLEAVYALAQFFKLIPSYNRYFSYTGSFDNPAVFAMLLAICVPIAVYYALQHKKGYRMWWLAALSYLVFIGFSESRASLLAATASLLVILLENKTVRNVLLRKKVLAACIPLILLLLFLIYRFKADSANGRLLIWRVSLDMFMEKPLFGFGPGGFLANYMDYQANYLSSHPDSKFLLLADNVNNPFNEYILVLVNYGLCGFACLLVLIILAIKRISTLDVDNKLLLFSITVVVMVISAFSYPFSEPFIWIVAGLIIMSALIPRNRIANVLVPIICTIAISMSVPRFLDERHWKMIMQESLAGKTEDMLPEYAELYEKLHDNGQFMYNYGAELHYSKHYKESLAIMKECSAILNDYDVQMLLADCHQNLGDTLIAIGCYNYASRMVPSKFLPQYQIMNLYLAHGDTVKAVNAANAILAKDVKVSRSKAVQRIINEAESVVKDVMSP
ncbi:MAG: O-antigen ligase family protein [Bacteroidaceae bacterium]|nr:O-antigen ligase family protein [Bacteroidaceae bacterium]